MRSADLGAALLSLRAAQLGQGDRRRDKAWIDLYGLQQGGLGFATLAPREVEIGQIDLRLRSLCIKSLAGNVLGEGKFEARTIL